ncbi:MAG: PIN domain-containing protein [Candidatus Competibacteraceae bacterium]
MAQRIEAYVDTSALIAFVDRSDTQHPLFRRLFADPPALITSTLVVAETHGWFLRRYDRNRALQFTAMLEIMTPLQIHQVGQDEQAAAVRCLRRFSDQDLTLADAVGLHLMQVYQVPVCWSTDFHLGLTGVPLVIHTH